MSGKGCFDSQDIMILPCSGGFNVGQISNGAAVELTQEGFGRMSCLAQIGEELSGVVQPVNDPKKIIVIDGCDLACGKAVLEKAGVPLKKHIIVTQLGIQKNQDLSVKPEDVAVVKHAVKLALKYPVKVSFDSPKPLSPGDRAKSKMFGAKCC